MRRTAAVVGTSVLVGITILPTTAAHAADATVSVLHAVPGLTVDVYANGEELIPNFEPGTLTDPMMLPPGTYDLQVFADGDTPDNADPAIEADGVEVPSGANATVVAHLDADGNPKLTVFANDVSRVEAGQARLTVRHTAAAPAVDVRAAGDVLFAGLTNPNEESAEVPADTYSADVVLAGTNDVAIGPADLELAEGTHTMVYAWGSAEDDNLDLAVQTIPNLHSAPNGVPGGETGMAAESPGVPLWAMALGLVSTVALVLATRQLVLQRVRR